ncbi:MAG: CheR family methyltransferase [Dissulfurispiraceae bacterium]
MSMNLIPFKNLIRDRCGLHFEDVRTASLSEGIRNRMEQKGMSSYPNYLDCLVYDQDEFQCLVNLLTVNETYFFREPGHLQLLTDRVIPELLATKKTGDKIRIISAGCSTGEEPYSLVIAVMEKYGAAANAFCTVIGADIDGDAVCKAEKGVYNTLSFRGLSDDLRERYFEPMPGNQHRIKDFIRERVEFRRLNLLSDDYPSEFSGADVIFYRNVSIYFEPDVQKHIFTKLAGILNENGYLFVSSTETLSHNIGVLSLVEINGIFLYEKHIEICLDERRRQHAPKEKKEVVRERPERKSPPGNAGAAERKKALTSVLTRSDDRRKDSPSLFDNVLSLAKEKRYEEALEKTESLIGQDPTFVKAYSLKAGILINMKRLEEAEAVCLMGIAKDLWCLEAYLLLGLISRIRNDEESALKRFKEALYIQSSCWLAHFYLADIHASRGEVEKACREYEIVIKLLTKGDVADHGLTFFPLSFPAENMAHLCRHNLTELRKRLQ